MLLLITVAGAQRCFHLLATSVLQAENKRKGIVSLSQTVLSTKGLGVGGVGWFSGQGALGLLFLYTTCTTYSSTNSRNNYSLIIPAVGTSYCGIINTTLCISSSWNHTKLIFQDKINLFYQFPLEYRQKDNFVRCVLESNTCLKSSISTFYHRIYLNWSFSGYKKSPQVNTLMSVTFARMRSRDSWAYAGGAGITTEDNQHSLLVTIGQFDDHSRDKIHPPRKH